MILHEEIYEGLNLMCSSLLHTNELQLQTPPEPQAPGASIYELREIALQSHPRLRVAEAKLAAADSAARLAARRAEAHALRRRGRARRVELLPRTAVGLELKRPAAAAFLLPLVTDGRAF